MEKMNGSLFIERLYREVGEMLNREKRAQPKDSRQLRKLDLAYGGVETIKHRFPSSEAWWAEAAAGLEEIRAQLVTMTENRLYTN